MFRIPFEFQVSYKLAALRKPIQKQEKVVFWSLESIRFCDSRVLKFIDLPNDYITIIFQQAPLVGPLVRQFHPVIDSIMMMESKVVNQVSWSTWQRSHASQNFFQGCQIHVWGLLLRKGQVLEKSVWGRFRNTYNTTTPVVF